MKTVRYFAFPLTAGLLGFATPVLAASGIGSGMLRIFGGFSLAHSGDLALLVTGAAGLIIGRRVSDARGKEHEQSDA